MTETRLDARPDSLIEQTFRVQDGGGRTVRFVGVLLAQVSSERKSSPRWTVAELYRTTRHLYVIHRVGRSVVFHGADCNLARQNRLPYGHEVPGGVQVDDVAGRYPCVTCNPLSTDPPETLRYEQDRHWTTITETAQEALERLYRNDSGTRWLPWINAKLIEQARVRDAEIRAAWAVEVDL